MRLFERFVPNYCACSELFVLYFKSSALLDCLMLWEYQQLIGILRGNATEGRLRCRYDFLRP